MTRITGEQFELLEAIVDAYWTKLESGQKLDFMYFTEGGMRGTFIQHPSLDPNPRPVDYGDLEELESLGLVRLSHSRDRSGSMVPTADAKHVVEEQRRLQEIARADAAISSGSSGSGISWEATLPVLEAVVDLYSQASAGEDVSQMQVNQRLQREDGDSDTSRAFEVLEHGGYVQGTASIEQLPGALTVVPTERALQLLAGWPADGAVALERFVAILENRIDTTTDKDEKGKLRAILQAVQGVGQELAADVLAKVIMGG